MAFKVQYKGRPGDNGEPTGKWTDVGGQADDMDQAAAEAHMADVQSTDEELELRVVEA